MHFGELSARGSHQVVSAPQAINAGGWEGREGPGKVRGCRSDPQGPQQSLHVRLFHWHPAHSSGSHPHPGSPSLLGTLGIHLYKTALSRLHARSTCSLTVCWEVSGGKRLTVEARVSLLGAFIPEG